jgi:hypothetical protein
MENLNNKRGVSLAVAESIDAWRVVPRFAIVCYMALVAYIIQWFVSIETHVQTTCQADVLQVLLDKDIDVAQAESIACTVMGVVGGPQTSHTIIATTIAGLATAIFGLYTSTGNDWSKSILPWKFGESKVEE